MVIIKMAPRQSRQAAESRAALAPLKKKVTKAEAEIELLSKRIAVVDRDLADGSLYQRDPARAPDDGAGWSDFGP